MNLIRDGLDGTDGLKYNVTQLYYFHTDSYKYIKSTDHYNKV